MDDVAVVAGSLAQQPGRGGHTWFVLQYLIGLRRLGWDVLFLDRLDPDMCVDAHGMPAAAEESENLSYLHAVMSEHGFADAYSVFADGGRRTFGMERSEVLDRVRRAPFLLNVMGFFNDEEVLAASRRRVFLDIDPGFPQMWCDLGLADPFRGHDVFVTIGQRIGADDCTIPDCGRTWITTPQPVVLEEWPCRPGSERGFTSVGAWRGPYAPVEHAGVTYGLRVHEFRRFAPLPRMCGGSFELALDIHPAEERDLALLDENGWTLADPARVAGGPDAYRRYIGGSAAEFMVAKGMYVQSRSGWVSERSLCYLASGKPVLAQDTGFSEVLPCGEGLIAYSTLEEAAEGVDELRRSYGRHARAARRLAEEHFDSDRVLGRLTEALLAT